MSPWWFLVAYLGGVLTGMLVFILATPRSRR